MTYIATLLEVFEGALKDYTVSRTLQERVQKNPSGKGSLEPL